ncbi:MAG: RNA polymerase sigma factor [Acidimicrobiia bacterium]|nr:RNA polymerase sigma factor [Acidimicrobiia bacterium]
MLMTLDSRLPQVDPDLHSSFEDLAARYKHHVFRLAVSILGPGFEPEAEDVTQDVFLRVHRELSSFRGESKFSTWLYRIAWNRAFDIKQRSRYRLPHLADTALAALSDPSAGPHDVLHHKARLAALHESIAELPELYQTVLRLHYWFGAGIAEISELVGAPEGTVKSYLHRARQRLAEALKEKGFDA